MKTFRFVFSSILLLFICPFVSGQENFQLTTNWELSLKEDSSEIVHKMITSFNGYIVAVGESVSKKTKDSDGLFMIIDPMDGKRNCWKQFGGRGKDVFTAVVQNFDGTFTIVGYTNSKSGSNSSGWVLRVNEVGKLLKESIIPNRKGAKEKIIDLAINSNGSVLAVGMQYLKGKPSVWVMNINNELYGQKKKVPINDLSRVNAICAGNDGHFVMVGNTVNKGKKVGVDAWVMKVDELGKRLWSAGKCFGGSGFQNANSVNYSAANGGYIVAGSNSSLSAGKKDMWVLKLSEDGLAEWEKLFGGSKEDIASSIIELSDGRYAIAGHTKSHMSQAKYAALKIIITDKHGNQLSEKVETIYAANGDNIAHAILELFGAENIVLAANAKPKKSRWDPTPFLGTFMYRLRPSLGGKSGSADNGISLTKVQFEDGNKNGFWSKGERGFAYFDITNETSNSIYNVKALVKGDNSIASKLDFHKAVMLGTLNAHQTKRLVIPIQTKKVLKEEVQLNIVIEAEQGKLAQIEGRLSSIKREPASLEISEFSFDPKAPKSGEIVKLQVKLINKGSLSSPAIPVAFKLPIGLIPQSSKQFTIPQIHPGESKLVDFSFIYGSDYQKDTISILFSTKRVGQVKAIDETLNLSINKVIKPVIEKEDMVFVWAQPDVSNHRDIIDIHRNIAEIKVISISSKKLVKKRFATRINGTRHQGSKKSESSLSSGILNSQGKIQQSFSTFVKLQPGLNSVEVVYYGDDDQTAIGESQQISFNYIPPENPSLWIISIGVEHEDLKYTIKDAEDFAAIYEGLQGTNGHGFKKVVVKKLLQKEETSKLNLQKTFQDLRYEAIKDGDLVIVFISSHGKISSTIKDKFLLLPSDYDARYEDLTSLDFEDDILNQLRPMKGNKLVFIDACQSGTIGSKSFDDKATSKVMSDLIESTKGLEIFASCSSSELSYESDSWNNGAFTKAILEAFKDSKVTVDGKTIHSDIYREHPTISGKLEQGSDGVITIRELKEFIEKRVPYLVRTRKHKAQNPKVWRDYNLDHNTGIFMVY